MTLPGTQLRDPLYRVSPRAKTFWTVRALCPWLVIGLIEAAILIGNAAGAHPDDGSRTAVVVTSVIMAITTVLATAHLIVMPRWRYRVHLWEITDTAIYAQSGWITQERRIAPASRLQTVDVHRGPLEQLFNLSNVTVTTASAAGPIHIRGLDRRVAEDVVAHLSIIAAANHGDAT